MIVNENTFESKSDLEREEKAIQLFVNQFEGSYEKLGWNDVDFKVFDKNKQHIAFAEIKGVMRYDVANAFPLMLSARKLVKLQEKMFHNPTTASVVIWSCTDGIIYGKLKELHGNVKWGGMFVKREGSVRDREMIVTFPQQKEFKTVMFPQNGI